MEVKVHFLTSILVSLALYPFFGWISFFFIVGGFLVDFDHYLDYLVHTGDWSVKKAVRYFRKRRFTKNIPRLHIFHTVEAFIVLAILSLYSKIFLTILLGFLFHMLLDLINTAQHNTWRDRTNSILLYLLRGVKVKKRKR